MVQAQVLALLAELQRERGMAMLFITHDLSVLTATCRRLAVMYAGRIIEEGPSDEVFVAPEHPYTRALMSAEPLPLPSHLRTERRIRLEGEIPSPVAPPSGCRFRTRCAHVMPRCAAEEPAWRELRPGHFAACHFATAEGAPT
jgi:peptide/nickel transport system ATP-binding protein/oligopeptide transport system ATP-binding protein